MPTKIDVAALNVKATSLFEDSKSVTVRSKEAKKECDRKIAEVEAALSETQKALDSKELTPAETKSVTRAHDRLNISKNYLAKAVGGFNHAENAQHLASEALAKKRSEKDALIKKRAEERKVRDENRKKAEAAAVKK